MSENKRMNQAGWRNVSSFVKRMKSDVYRPFLMLQDDAVSELVTSQGKRMCAMVAGALSAIRRVRRLPADANGNPKMFSLVNELLENCSSPITQKSLCDFLEANAARQLYDEELSCLSAFLTLGSAIFYIRNRDDVCLCNILRVAEIDFETVFYAFSGVERIFLTEAAGIYPDSDRRTRALYHARLQREVRRRKGDAFAVCREIVARANRENVSIGAVMPPVRGNAGTLYFYFLFTITLALTALYAVLIGDLAALLLVPLVTVPVYTLVREFLPPFFKNSGERLLPRLVGTAPTKTKVLVTVATLLFGEEKDAAIFDKLEDFYLTNGDEMCCFAALCDLPSCEKRTSEKDAAVISYAMRRIEALRAKYGDHFALFLRERRRSVSENAYIGWERKRGGVLELCRFLRGKKTSICISSFNADLWGDVRYLITLDADTNLYIGAVRELVGTILHPENRAKIDPKRGIVVSGHAVIQPRMATSLEAASVSLFAGLTGGAAGIDVYAGTAADLYQQVFDEGIFCGKGILDIDAYLTVCDGFFPKERILSHDLAEGNLLRAALAADIVLTDSTPKNVLSYYTRAHRWLRGDLQILPYLCKTVRDASGNRRKNPMSPLSKYKIFDNLLRGLTPLAALSSLFLSVAFGLRIAGITALFSLFYLGMPVLVRLIGGIFSGNLLMAARRFYSVTLPHFLDTAAYALFRAGALAHEAALFADAACRTVYRFTVSHRNFLNWTTAAEGDGKSHDGIDGVVKAMWFSLVAGITAVFLPMGIFRILGILWLAFPFVMHGLSKEKTKCARLTEPQREALTDDLRAAWRFFRDLVDEETNYLPPDNYQLSPTERIAMRTSPTNIGLYLLSALAARDMGIITSEELCTYAKGTAASLSRMQTWNGHFYNWYDIRTLEVIGEPFISTVDSGNLITFLVAFCEGLREYANECPSLIDSVYAYEKVIAAADFRALFHTKRNLFYIGYDVRSGKYSDSLYDTFMSESRTTGYYAAATRAVPRDAFFAMSRRVITKRGEMGIAAWSGTVFEYFMPSLLLPTAKNSLTDEALAFAYRREREAALTVDAMGKTRSVFGISESGYFGFDYEMNYQYKAFGIPSLSLDPMAGDAAVIAPYASFLMLERDVPRILSNLSSLRALGMVGKYGFYEALDLDPSRVGCGYAIIKSYMAHHVGMSIVAISNVISGGIFRRRFMRSPRMRASRELLSEKIPVSAKSFQDRRRLAPKAPKPHYSPVPEETAPQYAYNLLSPEVTLLSNNKSKIVASSSGHIELSDGGELLCLSEYDRFTLGGGLRLYAVIDGVPFSAVPLSVTPEGFSADFDFHMAADATEYTARASDGKREYTLRVKLSVYPDREIYAISVWISGRFRRAYAFLYFEPTMEMRRHYTAHRSFSDLFIESEMLPDEETLLFTRRQRSDKKANRLLGVTCSHGIASFDTMRDAVLPLMASEKDYADASKRKLGNTQGAVIVPACAVQSGTLHASHESITFYLGYGKDADDLLYLLAKCRGEKGRSKRSAMGDILNLQYATAGLDASVSSLEHFVLRNMYFDTSCREADRIIDKGCLYRYSVSGVNPIVVALVSSEEEDQKRRLSRLIRLFKYMCIRAVRYDFLILFAESDSYHQPMRKKIEGLIRRAGCENFVSLSGGIFMIGEKELSASERAGILSLATVTFDLSVPPDKEAARGLSYVPVSEAMRERLLCGYGTSVGDAAAPLIQPIKGVCGGYFHRDGFVIEKPHGRVPWAHIVASENFGTVMTENSLGFTYAGNAGLRKLTPHTADAMREDTGERLILRIYDRFDASLYADYDMIAGAKFVNFAFGYAEYAGEAGGIDYQVTVSLVGRHTAKHMAITLEGGKAAEIPIAVAYSVRPCLGEQCERTSLYQMRRCDGGLLVMRMTSEGLQKGLALLSAEATGAYMSEASFRSDGKASDGRNDRAILLSGGTLSGKREVSFFLLSYRTEEQLEFLRRLCLGEASVRYRVDERLFSSLSIQTSEPLFDEVVNKWSLYQTLYARIYARSGYYQVSGAYGFRDQLQDAMAMIPVLPQTAKVLILRAAAHQYESGGVMHWWHQEAGIGMMTRCSDDFLWLPFVTAHYVEKTGDASILETNIAYLASPPLMRGEGERYERAQKSKCHESLLLHLCRACEYGMKRGANGLPLMGSGDWNDGMNLVGAKGQGESVWLAEFTAIVYHKMLSLLRMYGMTERIARYEGEIDHLLLSVENAFDGEWYKRGFYDDGSPLGSAKRKECQIDLMPQAFASMANAELGGQLRETKRAMDAVYRRLFDKENKLVRLLTPPFDKDAQSPGYIKGYVPGIRENGGQYTHAAVFAALGFFAEKENDRGAELLFAMHPALRCASPTLAEPYKIEPYVLAGDVYANPSHMGRGGWSWYTGSAAWYRRAVTEVLCGYTESAGGFALAPHLSERFSACEITVNHQGTFYHAVISLGDKNRILLDGVPTDSDAREMLFPWDGKSHEIILTVKRE